GTAGQSSWRTAAPRAAAARPDGSCKDRDAARPARHAAGARVERHTPCCNHRRGWRDHLERSSHAFAQQCRARDHRHTLVRASLLRTEEGEGSMKAGVTERQAAVLALIEDDVAAGAPPPNTVELSRRTTFSTGEIARILDA